MISHIAWIALCCGLLAACGKNDPAGVETPAAVETSASNGAPGDGWVAMETLGDGAWQPIDGATDVAWNDEERILRIGVGTDLNGVRWTGALPSAPYEVEWEAKRVSGSDFFCGLTFPTRSPQECVSLILGGWGGSLVGISSIDGMDAADNSTGMQFEFEDKRWYRIRVVVEEQRLQAWIDGQQVIDADTEERRLSLREGPIENCAPFGVATWLTIGELRGMRWRKLGD